MESAINEQAEEMKRLFAKQVELTLRYYRKAYPGEEFLDPDIICSFDIHQDALNTYKEFGYPSDYIDSIDNRANWGTTRGLTIHNFLLNKQSRIIIDISKSRNDTIIHELTHVSDYYGYCKRNGHLQMNYLELLQIDDFMCLYLFSEFRAFYRGAMFTSEDLELRMKYEMEKFHNNQMKCINNQDFEGYYYHLIRYEAFSCAYYDKRVEKEVVENIMRGDDENSLHSLIKLLYPLRNKTFEEIEPHFDDLKRYLDALTST